MKLTDCLIITLLLSTTTYAQDAGKKAGAPKPGQFETALKSFDRAGDNLGKWS